MYGTTAHDVYMILRNTNTDDYHIIVASFKEYLHTSKCFEAIPSNNWTLYSCTDKSCTSNPIILYDIHIPGTIITTTATSVVLLYTETSSDSGILAFMGN